LPLLLRPELGLGFDVFLSPLLTDLAVLDIAAFDGALQNADATRGARGVSVVVLAKAGV